MLLSIAACYNDPSYLEKEDSKKRKGIGIVPPDALNQKKNGNGYEESQRRKD